MYRAGSLRAVAEEISKYKLELVGEYRRSDGTELALNQQASFSRVSYIVCKTDFIIYLTLSCCLAKKQ
jgi:hypothetical protein